jgi:hypothetical protein
MVTVWERFTYKLTIGHTRSWQFDFFPHKFSPISNWRLRHDVAKHQCEKGSNNNYAVKYCEKEGIFLRIVHN